MNHEHHLDHRPAPARAGRRGGRHRVDAGPVPAGRRPGSAVVPLVLDDPARAALAVPHLLGVHPDPDTLMLVGLRRRCPEIIITAPVQVLGTDPGAMAAFFYVEAALRGGAAGFILKDTSPAHLAQIVRTLTVSGVVLSPHVTRTVVDGHLGGAADPAAVERLAGLTDREREVLLLAAGGLSNGDIGARVHLSAATVKDHFSAILGKLRVSNRVQAALLAQRAGLLRTEASSAPTAAVTTEARRSGRP